MKIDTYRKAANIDKEASALASLAIKLAEGGIPNIPQEDYYALSKESLKALQEAALAALDTQLKRVRKDFEKLTD